MTKDNNSDILKLRKEILSNSINESKVEYVKCIYEFSFIYAFIFLGLVYLNYLEGYNNILMYPLIFMSLILLAILFSGLYSTLKNSKLSSKEKSNKIIYSPVPLRINKKYHRKIKKIGRYKPVYISAKYYTKLMLKGVDAEEVLDYIYSDTYFVRPIIKIY